MKSKIFYTFFAIIIFWGANSFSQSKGKQGFNLPIVDLDKEVQLQTVVDKEKDQYLGHPPYSWRMEKP
jgi:hypothetical protein